MRVLIVDDEAPARERLQRLLALVADVEVVGQAEDALDALKQIEALAPDLLLLDVQMPGASGLDLAASLPDPAPGIVFVTAYDQYALQAFEVAALDYLLKPVAPEQLQRALLRARARSSGERDAPARPLPLRLLIPDRGRTHVLALGDVIWLEAADNYVQVHTVQEAPLMRRTLVGILQDLGPGFVRTHRSAAVALAHVLTLEALDKGDAVVRMHGGATVPCSRSFRPALLQRLAGQGDVQRG